VYSKLSSLLLPEPATVIESTSKLESLLYIPAPAVLFTRMNNTVIDCEGFIQPGQALSGAGAVLVYSHRKWLKTCAATPACVIIHFDFMSLQFITSFPRDPGGGCLESGIEPVAGIAGNRD
jgi:hypothetical protein